MHELSLMESVVDIVRQSAMENNIDRINKLRLVVGKLSMALPDSLQFAFQVLGQDEMFKNAELEIEEKEIICQCHGCQEHFTVKNNYNFICPHCGCNDVAIIEGRELYLDYYEGENSNDTNSGRN